MKDTFIDSLNEASEILSKQLNAKLHFVIYEDVNDGYIENECVELIDTISELPVSFKYINTNSSTNDIVDAFFHAAKNWSESRYEAPFDCPICGNTALYCIDREIYNTSDVDWHDVFICEECGAELLSEPQYDNTIKFIRRIGDD